MDIIEFERRLYNREGDTPEKQRAISKVVDLCAELLADGTDPMSLVSILTGSSDLIVQETYSNDYYLRYLSFVQNVARRCHALHQLDPDLRIKFGSPPDEKPDGPPL
jgi:hypothetical protein